MAELEDGGSHATVERSTDDGGTPVIRIAGEVDMSNVLSIEAQFEPVLTTRPTRVLFDLSALTFIDSSGIAALLRAAERTGRLELQSASTTVRRIIQATGLTDVLHVAP